jgi:hypothetical protein
MATTENTYTGDGVTVLFSFTFPYLSEAHIKVSLNGADTTAYTLANATTIQMNSAPANGAVVRIYRVTNQDEPSSTFYPGSAIRTVDLNDNFRQALYIAQETTDRSITGDSPTLLGDLDFNSNRGINLASPIDGADACTKGYVDAIAITGDPTVTQNGTGAIARTWDSKLSDLVTTNDFSGAPDGEIASVGYANRAQLYVDSASNVKLICDPTAGDNFQDMCHWISSGHQVEPGGALYLEVADGLHNLSTFVDLFDNQVLDIRGSAAPDFFTISGITITPAGGSLYNATVTVTAQLPASVVPGYAVGCQNVQGDNGAESINGAHIVTSVAIDRLSFSFQYRSFGVVPTTPTSIVTTTTLGLEGSRVLVPKACLRVSSAGWDGAAREGFINCLRGAKLSMWNIGISFNGTTGSHDILFATNPGSSINLADRVIISGAGDFVLRLGYGAGLYANRCCFGGSTTANQILQATGSCNASFIRCSMGSAIQGGLVPTVSSQFTTTQCLLTGFDYGLRPTYSDSSITWLNARISHCNRGVWADEGIINIDSLSMIRSCTDPIQLSGGYIYGNPSISGNTNATVESNVLTNGGAWLPSNQEGIGLVATGLNGGPLAGFRNAIINGSFDHWQRGTSFGSLATNTYHADRWYITFTGGGTRTISRQLFPIGQLDVPGDPTYYLNWDQTVAGSGQTANDLRQKIEGVRTFAGQQVTVSLWAKASAPINSNGVRVVQDFGTGGSPSSAVTKSSAAFSLTTSWQRFSFTTTLDSIAGKTLGSDGNDNLYISIRMPINTTFNIDIAQVQIEAGPVATPFERRPIGVELALCQRYYYVADANRDTIHRRWGGSEVGNYTLGQTFFPVTMRAVPNVTTSTPTYTNCSALTADPINATNVGWTVSVTSAAAVYGATWAETYLNAEL